MKAILIDSKNKTVSEVDVSKKNTLNDWYKLIDCRLVEVACYINDKEDSLMVDEEGLIKDELKETDPFFSIQIDGQELVYAGNGLIVGVNSEGDSISHHESVEKITPLVKFMTLKEVRRLSQSFF